MDHRQRAYIGKLKACASIKEHWAHIDCAVGFGHTNMDVGCLQSAPSLDRLTCGGLGDIMISDAVYFRR